jgi:hypothetical protein
MSRLTKSGWRWVAAAVLAGTVALLLIFGALQAAVEQSPVCDQHTTQYQGKPDALAAAEGNEADAAEDDAEPAEQQPHFCYLGHTAEEWIGILTAALAGFTWALAMATAALWLDARSNGEKQLKAAALNLRAVHRQMQASQKSTIEQLRVAQQSANALILAQRPWVSVDLRLLSVTRNKDAALEWLFRPVCLNIGNTPATNVRVAVAISPHPVTMDGWDFDKVVTTASQTVQAHHHKGFALFPAESDASDGANHKEVFTQSDLEAAVSDGRYALTACVLVLYDFVGGTGLTRRIYILTPHGEREYFDIGALKIEASEVKLTRVPLSERAS